MLRGNDKIKGVLIFRIDANYLTEKGDLLCKTIDDWNASNGCESFTTTFIIEEHLGDLIVDYSFDEINKDKIEKLTKQILERFDITYILI